MVQTRAQRRANRCTATRWLLLPEQENDDGDHLLCHTTPVRVVPAGHIGHSFSHFSLSISWAPDSFGSRVILASLCTGLSWFANTLCAVRLGLTLAFGNLMGAQKQACYCSVERTLQSPFLFFVVNHVLKRLLLTHPWKWMHAFWKTKN